MRVHFVADDSAGAEALHYAAAAARWLQGRGWAVSADPGENPELSQWFSPFNDATASGGGRVVFWSGAFREPEPEFRVEIRGTKLRMTGAGAIMELPLAFSPSTFSFPRKPPLDVPRFLMRGDPIASRRMRMSSRIITELRRRGFPLELVIYGDIPDEFVRASPPDEIHEGTSVVTLAGLVRTASAILESTDREAELTPAFALGRSLGLPTFVHRDAVSSHAGPACCLVEEWSADAFADVMSSSDQRSPISPDERALQQSFEQFEKVLLDRR